MAIDLIGGGLDEAPQAYKPIDAVMEEQKDLVEVLGKFQPKIVRMAAEENLRSTVYIASWSRRRGIAI